MSFCDGHLPSLATGSPALPTNASADGSAVEMFFAWGAATKTVAVSATAALSTVPPHPSPPRRREPGETGSRWKVAVVEIQGNGCELGAPGGGPFCGGGPHGVWAGASSFALWSSTMGSFSAALIPSSS